MATINQSPKLVSLLAKIHSSEAEVINKIDPLKIESEIESVVNGDDLITYLIVNTELKDGKWGLSIFLLTNSKLAKIEIDDQGLKSSSAYFNQVVGVTRKVFNETKDDYDTKTAVEFTHGSWGLWYSSKEKDIDAFFQKIDETIRHIKES